MSCDSKININFNITVNLNKILKQKIVITKKINVSCVEVKFPKEMIKLTEAFKFNQIKLNRDVETKMCNNIKTIMYQKMLLPTTICQSFSARIIF